MNKLYFLILLVFLGISTNLSAQSSSNNNSNSGSSSGSGSNSCSNNNGNQDEDDDDEDDDEDEEGSSCGNNGNGGNGNGGGNNGGGSCGNGNNGNGGNGGNGNGGGNNGGGSCGSGNNGNGGNGGNGNGGGNNGGGSCGDGNNGNNGSGGNGNGGGNNGGGSCGNGNNGNNGSGGNGNGGGNNGGGSCDNGNGGNNNNGNGGCNGNNGNNNDDDEEEDDDDDNWNGGGSGNGGNGGGNNGCDSDNDDDEEGNDGGDNNSNNFSFDCPVDATLYCDYNIDPSFTGVPSSTASISYTFLDQVVSASCPFIVVRHWTITDTSGNSATCTQTISVVDNVAPVITINTSAISSCEDLNNISYTVTDCDPNPNVSVTYTTSDGPPAENVDCNINGFRTQTQGGWGANPNGNNPAVYLYAHFNEAFPNGLTIGCNNSLTLSSVQAITAFLPSGSTPASLPSGALLNPGGTYNNVLAGQLVTAMLNVGFDNSNVSFGASESNAMDLIIANGTFQGMNIQQLIQIANEVIGGCSTAYSFSQLNEALTSFNENFDNGNQNNGFLECPSSDATSDVNDNTACELIVNYTITASDACGNASSISGSFSYTDSSAPVFVDAPTEIHISCGEEIPDISAVDDCGNTEVSITFVDSEFSGACIPTIERVYTATDACGNAASFTQYIFIDDTTAPEISGVDAFVSIACSSDIDFQEPTIYDACSEVSVLYSEMNNLQGCSGTITRTWVAVDACGNSATFTQTVSIQDDLPPVFNFIPTDVQIYCGGEVPSDMATATDNCGAVDILISVEEIISEGACAQIQRIFRAQDACGNISLATQTITLIDDVAPIFINEPSDITLSCGDAIPSSVLVASDNCDSNVAVELEETYFIDGCSTIILRMWTATDNCGNTVTASQQIEIVDLEAPIFNMEEEVTVACGASQNTSINVTDNCSEDITISYSDIVIGEGCSYEILRTWSAIDACGNEASFEQLIHVVDNQAPVFAFVPPSFTSACTTPSELGTPVVTDNCSTQIVPTLVEAWTGSGCAQVLTRTWTAQDACGNMSTATQIITVADNLPPVIVGVPQSYTVSCSEFVYPQVPTTVTAEDNCVGEPTLTFEETTVPGECSGSYSILRTWTAFDECGNSTVASQTISIADTQAPTWSFIPQDIQIACGESAPEAPQPIATDNCSNDVIVDFSEFEEVGSCGVTIYRSWYAFDECGNTAYLSQTISMIDDVAPTFVNVPSATLEVSCGNIPAAGVLEATDNCSSVDVYMMENAVGNGCPYTIERTWVATDGCGNTSSFTQTIFVSDAVAPQFVNPPADMEVSCDQVPPMVTPAISDCSSTQVFSEEIISETGCATQYDITRIFTAIDLCGNTTEWIQTIHVTDTEAPLLTNVPDDMTIGCGEIPEVANVIAIDNCESTVELMYEESIASSASDLQSCSLSTPDAIFGDVAFWLPGIAGVSENYSIVNTGAFSQNLSNGTATVDAEVMNNQDPNQRWIIHLELANARNWNEWSALGRSYKDDLNIAAGYQTDWTYYEMLPSSFAQGAGSLTGSNLTFTHMPSSYYYGFQVGERANNRNADYGMSGWLYYNGSVNGTQVTGHGDFFASNDCCTAQTISRTWTAIDCAGNVSTHTQLIHVQPSPVAMSYSASAQRQEPSIAVNNTGDKFFRVIFSAPSDGQASIDVYNSAGQKMDAVYTGSLNAGDTYTIMYAAPSVENAMYFFRLTTKEGGATASALMLR